MINIMLSYARCGATILNKCLGSFGDVVMLSEVNPLDNGNNPVFGKMDVAAQCRTWYGFELRNNDFKNAVSECNDYCSANHKKLIVRDWSTANFRRMPENNFNPPNRFIALEELAEIDELKIFTLVRNPIDVFISNEMDPVDMEGYHHFVNALDKITHNKIIRYESFCRSPQDVIREICDYIGLSYSDEWRSYYKNDRVNGDNVIKGGSRGARQVKISPLSRRRVGRRAIREINESNQIRETCRLLNYPANYFEGPIESRIDWAESLLRRFTFSLFKV
ncbi:MAG: sulfotransferase [Bacteroidetes bacterium]|nr:sulfotransferase [Bacteroidota bacterium]